MNSKFDPAGSSYETQIAQEKDGFWMTLTVVTPPHVWSSKARLEATSWREAHAEASGQLSAMRRILGSSYAPERVVRCPSCSSQAKIIHNPATPPGGGDKVGAELTPALQVAREGPVPVQVERGCGWGKTGRLVRCGVCTLPLRASRLVSLDAWYPNRIGGSHWCGHKRCIRKLWMLAAIVRNLGYADYPEELRMKYDPETDGDQDDGSDGPWG